MFEPDGAMVEWQIVYGDIGKDFFPEMYIGGKFKVDEVSGEVIGWSSALKVKMLADALGMDLHFLAVVVMIVAATFFVNSIPSAPGALGTFEYAIHVTLGFFGFTGGAVVPFSLSMHVILFVPPACIAMIVVPQLGIGLFDLRRGLSKGDLADNDNLNDQKND